MDCEIIRDDPRYDIVFTSLFHKGRLRTMQELMYKDIFETLKTLCGVLLSVTLVTVQISVN